jgi:hypothetical protein
MYNVRGTFTNQRKYSQHGFHQLLELARVKALDTIEIENQVKARVKKMEKAAKGGSWGKFLDAADFIAGFTPTFFDDAVIGTAKSINYDKLRARAVGGIDTSNVQFLGQAAKDASFKMKELSKKHLDKLKFSNTIGDVGIDLMFKAVMESDAVQDKLESYRKVETGPGGEEIKINSKGEKFYYPVENPTKAALIKPENIKTETIPFKERINPKNWGELLKGDDGLLKTFGKEFKSYLSKGPKKYEEENLLSMTKGQLTANDYLKLSMLGLGGDAGDIWSYITEKFPELDLKDKE